MQRSAKALLLVVSLGTILFAQDPKPAAQTPAAADNKAGAYYNFAMGRLYAELAGSEGNKDYVNKAIQHYQEALKLDPSAGIIFEELTDLYIQTGHLQDAVSQAEDILKNNPSNLDARRMLGRIYTRMIGNTRENTVDERYLRQAIDEYQKITKQDPKDAESWVILGRLYRVANNSVDAEKAYNAAIQLDPENEDALTGLAMMYSDLGDTKRAIEKLKAVTDKSPNERTLAALATAYEQMNDYKSAAEALKRAVALAPDNDRLVRGLAQDLYYSEQFDEALDMYQQLAADEPKDPQLRLRIAEIYRSKRDFSKAQDALAKAKAIEPEGLDVRYEEVNLMEAQGKTKEAITTLKALLDDSARKTYSGADAKNRAMLLERLGGLYRSAEQYPQAIDTFRQISAVDKDSAPRVAVQVIATYRAAKDLTSAMREAEAAEKKFPDDRLVKLEHANVLSDQGKVEEAAAEVRSLLKGNPRDRETQLALAQIYDKGKRYQDRDKALDEAEKLSTSKDDKEGVLFMRGAMYEREKKTAAAEAEFRKVLDLNPDNASALNYLGYMLADRNERLDEAYTLVKKAVDLDPDNGAYLDSLGWVYYRQGKLTDAEALLVRALDRMNGDGTVHEHLGDVYFQMGKIRDAISQWQLSLKAFQTASQSDFDPDEPAKVTKKLDEARVRLARETGKK
jgi:tetratricopeptide (TPR) repeat protein